MLYKTNQLTPNAQTAKEITINLYYETVSVISRESGNI
jgi:hypothetical protein